MFCSRCGNPLADGAAYCMRCGNPTAAGMPAITMKRPAIITILAVLYLVFGPILLLVGGGMTIAGAVSTDKDAGVVIVVGLIMAIVGALQIAVGVGLLKMQSWARIAQIIFSCIGLAGFPLGTIINGLILYYLFRPGIVALFAGKTAKELTAEEAASILEVQRSGAGVVIAVLAIFIGLVAFSGILAAIAIPNLLTAMQRAKQKRTIADIRSLTTSIEAYAVDHKEYPNANDGTSLAGALSPKYMASVPVVDGWSHPIRYKCWSSTGGGCDHFSLSSGGKDGKFEGEDVQTYGAPHSNTNFDCDIVYADGAFVSYPDGLPQ